MNTGLQVVIAWVELGASQEDMRDENYAEKRIDRMSNFELLETIADATDWADSLSHEELEKRGWN